MVRVFVSHSGHDRPFVEDEIVPLLQAHGVGTWYCREEVLAGEDFERAIFRGLADCDWFLLVLSPAALASAWVRREVAWAAEHRTGRLVPVLLADCHPEQLHLGLQTIHRLDFRLPAERHAARKELLRVWGIDTSAAEGDPSEEAAFQERFLASRLGGPPVSAKLTTALAAFAEDDDHVPCLVAGVPGSGKAVVLAHFVAAFRREHPETLVLPYFLGARPTAPLALLLRRFCKALAWRFGSPGPLPEGVPALKAEFARRLAAVPAGERVVLVIDDLDRLDEADGARTLDWLPRTLPGHVKVVLGCDADARTGEPLLRALRDRLTAVVSLAPFRRDAFRFEFVGHGSAAPPVGAGRDQLYLDVGNALRPGVIDSHHLGGAGRTTASLVLDHPQYVRDAVDSWRSPEGTFTLVLHQEPDLDCTAAAFLAREFLTTGRFPERARVLGNYVDRVDAGHPGFSQAAPFTLYAAHLYLGHRLGLRDWESPDGRWQRWVGDSFQVIDFVLDGVTRQRRSVFAVDAFACPGLFDEHDRREVLADLERYRRKLADPTTHARRYLLRLPGQLGDEVEAEALLVRDVRNDGDPGRCIFFKDWARTDATAAPRARGFVALAVFAAAAGQGGRCILSVRPDSGASLEGLGAELERAEARRRLELHGHDDRLHDARTGERLPDRLGYDNPDPWYDGRGHEYTIVDAPRAGTVLTPDEVEDVFVRFGSGRPLR
jgi:hypothetical protein